MRLLEGRFKTGDTVFVKKAQADVDRQIVEAGEQAAYDVGVHGLHPELIKLVGRMKFRTSYGQNLLKHVKEVCWIVGILATVRP